MYHNFVGIDIGKAEFYVAREGEKQVNAYANDETGFLTFYEAYQEHLASALVVLETTGGYEMPLIRFLQSQGVDVHRANTRKVKFFIRSHGRLGKSDSIDALGLAQYGKERHAGLKVYQPREDLELLQLVNRRIELKQMLVQEKNRRQGPEQKSLKNSYNSMISAIEGEIEVIEGRMNGLLKLNSSFREEQAVLMSIPGIGELTALQLLCLLPELGQVDRKEIASLGGVAPHPNESGKRIGYRHTRGGRSQVKSVLFMAAMSASRSHSELGKTYERFLERGKKKMVALTALMRKQLVIANARLRDHRLEKALALGQAGATN